MMWVTPLRKAKVSSQILPWGFSSSERELSTPLSYLRVGCVIYLLFLQHKLSGSCGGELVLLVGVRDCCPGFCVFFFYLWNAWIVSSSFPPLKGQNCSRCFIALYLWQLFIILLHCTWKLQLLTGKDFRHKTSLLIVIWEIKAKTNIKSNIKMWL